MKKKVREITSRKMHYPTEYRIEKLNQYLTGGVDALRCRIRKPFSESLDKWIRRRLRMCLWKNWKNPRTRVRSLTQLGVPKGKAYEWGDSRKGCWRIFNSPILSKALGNANRHFQGLKSLQIRYKTLRHLS
ncbi:MAG: group II intron maturase-specific domain-containing protein [Bacillus sp. (in: firmicutes)]